MKNIYVKGYVNYEDEKYTFVYAKKKLTLISVNNKKNFFNEYKEVQKFEGYTVDGFGIVFYINNDIYYKDGTFECNPKCIIISRVQTNSFTNTSYDTLAISGGVINGFYKSKKIIENDQKGNLKLKNPEKTVSKESVTLNEKESTFELSIMNTDKKGDGIINFIECNSLLRIKYDDPKSCGSIFNDLKSVEKFFRFCTNRANVNFNNIFLERKNEDGKYEKVAEIIIPYMADNRVNADMIDYELLNGKVNDIFKFLDNSDYICSITPNDNMSFQRVSIQEYCAAFSCFESIYQYVNNTMEPNNQNEEEKVLQDVKDELLPLLIECEEKYKEINGLKRKYIKRFIHIIENANLKLEKSITNGLEKNKYLIDDLYYEAKEKIEKIGLSKAVNKAVEYRDIITHDKVVKLDEISKVIYELIVRLNYIMILEYIGVNKEEISNKIKFLAQKNII